jgi:hypothetical protein
MLVYQRVYHSRFYGSALEKPEHPDSSLEAPHANSVAIYSSWKPIVHADATVG